LLIAEQVQARSDGEPNSTVTVSLAAKRRSQAENDAFVIVGEPIEVSMTEYDVPALRAAFLNSLSLSHRSLYTLRDLYTGWTESVDAFRAARAVGTFMLPASADQASARRGYLAEYDRLEAELA